MLTVNEAFRKFKSRLELNEREQKNASARHTEVRDYLDTKFKVARSFLTGSYARHTKTKPLKDIDIFFELKEDEKHYRSKSPSVVIGDFHDALVEKYGDDAVRKQSRSVGVDFGVVVDADDNTDYRVVGVGRRTGLRRRRRLRDSGRRQRALDQDQSGDPRRQGHGGAPGVLERVERPGADGKVLGTTTAVTAKSRSKPSFLIEVMALQCLYGGWQGRFDYEIQGFLLDPGRPHLRRMV